jgi:hypothetical protein
MSGQKANSVMVARAVGAEIAFNSSGGADAWTMLMPLGAGNVLTTVDGRGPYPARLNRRPAPKRKQRPAWAHFATRRTLERSGQV